MQRAHSYAKLRIKSSAPALPEKENSVLCFLEHRTLADYAEVQLFCNVFFTCQAALSQQLQKPLEI